VRRFNKFISLHGIKALKEVVRDMGWKSFTVLYQRDDALVRLQEVLKDHGPQDAPITVRQLPHGDDFRL
jgi:glutamate receptor, ionotropic, invertebrate